MSNYMDDVPIKIADKYKPPPQVKLPRSILQSIDSAKHLVATVHYDFNLETNILKKLEEIRQLKESKENERKERLQSLEEDKKNKELLAAAETEERLKQLSVSEVFSPSTDESSEISPDDAAEDSPADNQISLYKTSEDENILKPTLISSINNYNSRNLLDDHDPITRMQQNVNVNDKYSILKMVNARNNVENLTYLDFEHDTSSPFDNMELKTINDMEMLAQILNMQPSASSSTENQTYAAPTHPNSYYPTTNGYYDPMYAQYQNYLSYPQMDAYASYGYDYNPVQPSVYSPPVEEPVEIVKNKSRSVPDIIRELDDEITSARIRQRERSYNVSPAPPKYSEEDPPAACSEPNKKDDLEHPFNSLPEELKTLCKSISGMGFPLERVARACQTLGSNDKKMIEYLLMMGELMDLGFTESQVASALSENHFNRDKALDHLVS